jgi:hypothetical protein
MSVLSAAAKRFPIRVGRNSRPLLLLFGVRGGNAYIDLDNDVAVSFGFFRFRTPLSNVISWRIEGPWLWITAIGVRMSIRHRDVSFDGSHLGGVRLDFGERVRWGPINVPAIYVTVEDLDGFAGALTERGIAGEDARRHST